MEVITTAHGFVLFCFQNITCATHIISHKIFTIDVYLASFSHFDKDTGIQRTPHAGIAQRVVVKVVQTQAGPLYHEATFIVAGVC